MDVVSDKHLHVAWRHRQCRELGCRDASERGKVLQRIDRIVGMVLPREQTREERDMTLLCLKSARIGGCRRDWRRFCGVIPLVLPSRGVQPPMQTRLVCMRQAPTTQGQTWLEHGAVMDGMTNIAPE